MRKEDNISTPILYDWQQPEAEHIAKVLQTEGVALEASDTGTGKTFIASHVAKTLGLRPLVIAPKSVTTPWLETLEMFGVEPLDVLNIEKLKTGKRQWLDKRGRGKLMTDWTWRLPQDAIIFWDEVHQAGGEKSQNSKLLALLKPYPIPVLGISATVADSPLRLKALGFLMGFHEYRNYQTWCRKNGCYPSPFAMNQMEFPKGPSRIKYLKQIHGMIFPKFGGRLLIDDLEEFPECSLQADEHDLAKRKDVQAEYDTLEDALHDVDNEESPLVLMQRARENVELLKVPLFEDLVTDMLDEGKSIVIFFSYRNPAETLLERLTKKLGFAPGFIYGGQKDRDQVVADFQADKNRVLIAMIQAGGISISLHDLHGNHPRVSLINPPLSVVQLKQALGRIWRAGAKTKAVQKIIFAAGTIEEKACTSVRRKLQNLSTLNDGDLNAGLTFEK